MAEQKCRGDWIVGGVCGLQRVASTRQYFSLKIDALTSTASSALCDAKEKKGHVNCDVLDVHVEAIANRTMGRGC